MKRQIRIGIDTGGTFTDFIISIDGKINIKKIPSTPHNPSLAIYEGVRDFVKKRIPFLVIHGTTVATNSLLERKGGRIALITTKGFEDVLFIGRQTRRNLYSLRGEKRPSLLPRKYCLGIDEWTTSAGEVKKKVSVQELEGIIETIYKRKAQAVAVSLINSYANFSNENFIKKELMKRGFLTSVSCDILPEYREYERTAVTAVNAFLMPVISQYLASLENKLHGVELQIMQSNEGYISSFAARKEPVRTVLSGPVGGVVGAFHLAKSSGFKNIITFDMGGTSSDVSLLDEKIRRTSESMVGDFPVRLPVVDIHTVGAGGGSVAYVDRGGSLRVGPQSAGADPGPACYGKGNIPTVTDANLVLGRLVPEFFLGGKMKVFSENSQDALKKLANKINKSLIETASGIIEIANANMEKAIRVISIERGFDPRGFSLFSFGGAGGMHAAEIASHLRIARVIVPKNAGVLSAFGLLLADSIKDYSKSFLKKAEDIKTEELMRLFQTLINKAKADILKEGFQERNIRVFQSIDLRYLGQSYEITIPFRSGSSYVDDFQKAHKRLYSYSHSDQPVEIVNIRVKVVGVTKKIKIKKAPFDGTNPERAFVKKQALFYDGKEYQASVFDRALLTPGNRMKGPSLVAGHESTAFLPPDFFLEVDGYFNLVMVKKT